MPLNKILPSGQDPIQDADEVLNHLVTVTADNVKGAHDAHMTIVDGKAYIVYEANDEQPGENSAWTFIYVAMSVVDISSGKVESVIKFARSEQQFDNVRLPVGCCFVPRILKKDTKTLRAFFASEHPGHRQSDTWYIDFYINTQTFDNKIYKMKLKTPLGIFDMQPQYFYEQAKVQGFRNPSTDNGFFLLDLGKKIDGRYYVTLNNFMSKQNALGLLNENMDTVEVLGNFNEPQEYLLSESGINKIPDDTWMAIIRNDGQNKNYCFSKSVDGVSWSKAEEKTFVSGGSNSKPTFDRFDNLYYLGWQAGPERSVFHIDVSTDCEHWERKFSFKVPGSSFQYPYFFEYEGSIYLTVTQGDKECIKFGKLCDIK